MAFIVNGKRYHMEAATAGKLFARALPLRQLSNGKGTRIELLRALPKGGFATGLSVRSAARSHSQRLMGLVQEQVSKWL